MDRFMIKFGSKPSMLRIFRMWWNDSKDEWITDGMNQSMNVVWMNVVERHAYEWILFAWIESFVFTSSTFTFWGKSRAKTSLSHLRLLLSEGTSRTQCVFEGLPMYKKCCVLQDKTHHGRWMGKLVRRTGAEHARLGSDHARIGLVQASFC